MQHHLFHLNPYNSISTPKVNSHYNCYMLLGYDILISEDLQAHLIGESMVVGHIPRFYPWMTSSFFSEINSLPSLFAQPDSIDA